MIVVLSWNVLAAPWASPRWYPEGMDAEVLERGRRVELATAILQGIPHDLACLQETTPPDLARLRDPRYDVHAADNDASLWSSWSTPEATWEPNGPAVMWRRDRFVDVETGAFDLGDHGNRAAWIRAREPRRSHTLRVVSVHLDADDRDRRRAELARLLEWCRPEPGVTDIVAGDLNADTVATSLAPSGIADLVAAAGFVDALVSVGRRAPTHPYARPTDEYASLATIDHVLVRNGTAIDGAVVDSDVWTIDDPAARLEATLRRTGSDHLPIVSSIALP